MPTRTDTHACARAHTHTHIHTHTHTQSTDVWAVATAGSAIETEFRTVFVNGKEVPFEFPDPEKGPYTPGNPNMYVD